MWIGPSRLLSRNRANTSLVGSIWPVMVVPVMVIASLPAVTTVACYHPGGDHSPRVLGGEQNERNCQHVGGAGGGAAYLFSGFGDVPLDQTARPEDLSELAREGG